MSTETRSQVIDIDNLHLAIDLSCQCIKGEKTPESFIKLMTYLFGQASNRLAIWESRDMKTILAFNRKEGGDKGLAFLLVSLSYILDLDTPGSIANFQIGLEQRQPWALKTLRTFLKALKRDPLVHVTPTEEFYAKRNWLVQHLLAELMYYKP